SPSSASGCTAGTWPTRSTSPPACRAWTSRRWAGRAPGAICRCVTTSPRPRCSTSTGPSPHGPRHRASTRWRSTWGPAPARTAPPALHAADPRREHLMSSTYQLPVLREEAPAPERTVYLIPSGDLRESANVPAWPYQQELERIVGEAGGATGRRVRRAFAEEHESGHGCLRLAVANFAPEVPGLVGLLNLNGGLTKMNREYSTLWTVDATDAWFRDGIASWIESGRIEHDASHVRPLPELPGTAEVELGRVLADQLRQDKAIIGIFDEGCMGMYNAIIDDEMLNPLGIYKERLSQSALWAEMQTVADEEADAVGTWLREAGMTFRLGTDEATELTETQLRWQHKMYIAALRISDDF